MRLIILTVFLAAFAPFVLEAQLVTFSPNDSTTTAQTVYNGGDAIGATIYINNPTAQAKNMRWQRVDYTLSKDWTIYQVCDPSYCITGDPFATAHNFVVQENAQGIFKIELNQNCATGAGDVRIQLWERSDSANTSQYITFRFDLTAAANCVATSISEAEKQNIKFFPNPVKDDFKITGIRDLKDVEVQIFNVIGSKVFSKTIDDSNPESATLNLEQLEQGVYFVKLFSNNSLVVTKKITKD